MQIDSNSLQTIILTHHHHPYSNTLITYDHCFVQLLLYAMQANHSNAKENHPINPHLNTIKDNNNRGTTLLNIESQGMLILIP